MSDRPSPIAGSWYPGDPEVLSQCIRDYLDRAVCEPPSGAIVGVVVPHAGYRYSGHIAAYAFRLVRETRPEIVAVVSPLHRVHPARLLTTAHEAYATPLGRVAVDNERLGVLDGLLRRRFGLELYRIKNDQEHSLEIELPFMQHLWGSFRLLPVMMRDQSAATARALGDALADTLSGRSALIVASSDLSHFHPQEQAVRLDRELLRRLEAFDPQAVLDGETEGSAYACGRGAIAATLWATKAMGAERVTVLRYGTSGEVGGDFQSVVGYAGAVISRR